MKFGSKYTEIERLHDWPHQFWDLKKPEINYLGLKVALMYTAYEFQVHNMSQQMWGVQCLLNCVYSQALWAATGCWTCSYVGDPAGHHTRHAACSPGLTRTRTPKHSMLNTTRLQWYIKVNSDVFWLVWNLMKHTSKQHNLWKALVHLLNMFNNLRNHHNYFFWRFKSETWDYGFNFICWRPQWNCKICTVIWVICEGQKVSPSCTRYLT